MKFIVAFATAAVLAAPAAAVTNLVTNGSFEAGNTGFTSEYTYAPSGPSAGVPEGVYLIDTNAANVHPSWANVTAEQGNNFLIVNGATSGNPTVWESGSIAVDAGTDYFFEAFATNICCSSFVGSGSLITFQVVGDVNTTTLATFNTGDSGVGVWQALSNTYNSGANTSVTLRLLNGSTEFGGNDFGVDNINFGTSSIVPEPATWAMMIMGFGLVGFAARRRRAVAA